MKSLEVGLRVELISRFVTNEFQRIAVFTKPFAVAPSPRGPGDDCAVLRATGRDTVVTTDAVFEGVHFTRRTFSMKDIGAKAVAVNVSDIAAMGAHPKWMVCSLGLPKWVTDQKLAQLGQGAAAMAKRFGIELIGGNVSRASELSVTMTMCGELPRGTVPLLRSGARPGDVLFVSGPLGRAAAGLAAFGAGRRWRSLVEAQRRPSPHVQFGLAVGRLCSAGLDVSDGLLQDLGHICAASKVGAEIDSSLLPIDADVRRFLGARAERAALTGGEDYVLLVAVSPRKLQAFERACGQLAAFRIGVLTAKRGVRVDGVQSTGRLGHTHF